jgi:thioesterase domain-containing protein
MAAALEDHGENIAFLGLLDTYFHIAPQVSDVSVLEYFEEFAGIEDKGIMERLSPFDREHLAEASPRLSKKERFTYAALWGQERGFWSNVSVELMNFIYADRENTEEMIRNLRLRRIQTPIHIWWAKDTLDSEGNPPVDWQCFTSGGVHLERVGGNHEEIIRDPHVHKSVDRVLRTVADSGRSPPIITR